MTTTSHPKPAASHRRRARGRARGARRLRRATRRHPGRQRGRARRRLARDALGGSQTLYGTRGLDRRRRRARRSPAASCSTTRSSTRSLITQIDQDLANGKTARRRALARGRREIARVTGQTAEDVADRSSPTPSPTTRTRSTPILKRGLSTEQYRALADLGIAVPVLRAAPGADVPRRRRRRQPRRIRRQRRRAARGSRDGRGLVPRGHQRHASTTRRARTGS